VTFLAVQQRVPEAGQKLITPESMMRLRIVLHSSGMPHPIAAFTKDYFF